MLGSAIPRRWIFSVALVGLVTIFAVTYAAVWSSPAHAASGTFGTGNTDGPALADPDKLAEAQPLTSGQVVRTGNTRAYTVNFIDATGKVNNNLVVNAIIWSTTGGISIISGQGTRTVVIRTDTAGNASVKVRVEQADLGNSVFVEQTGVLSVVNPPTSPPPPPPPRNPGTPPSSVPGADGVASPEARLLLSSTGVENANSPEQRAFSNRPVIDIPVGAVKDFFGVKIRVVDAAAQPAMPSRYTRGSFATDISFLNSSGATQSKFRLERPAQICLPTASSDRTQGFSRIRVLRFNSAVSQWVELTTTYNTITRQACANARNYSVFAIGVLKPPPKPVTGGGLPATGGWTPGTGLLALAGVVGVAFVGGSVFSLRRSRSVRPEKIRPHHL